MELLDQLYGFFESSDRYKEMTEKKNPPLPKSCYGQ